MDFQSPADFEGDYRKHLVVVNRQAGQSIGTGGSPAAVTWDFERLDSAGGFDTSQPDRIIILKSSLYLVTVQMNWDGGVTGARWSHLERVRASDGIQEVLGAHNRGDLANGDTGSIMWAGELLAGDAVRVKVFQNSGAPRNFGGANRSSGNPIASSTNTELSVIRLF